MSAPAIIAAAPIWKLGDHFRRYFSVGFVPPQRLLPGFRSYFDSDEGQVANFGQIQPF